MTNYIPIMEILHPQYKGIIYCAPKRTIAPLKYREKFVYFERINFPKHECDACLSQICINLAVKVYGDKYGYLQVGDDTLILHKSNIFFMQFNKIWVKQNYQKFNLDTKCHSEWNLSGPTNCKRSYWDTWHWDYQINAFKTLLINMTLSNDTLYKHCAYTLEKYLGKKNVVLYQPTIIDFLYIPGENLRNYIKLMDMFSFYKVVVEAALPNVITCLDPTGNNTLNAKGINQLSVIQANYASREDVERFPQEYIKTATQNNLSHVHPIKLFGILKKQESVTKISDIFCNYILPYLYS